MRDEFYYILRRCLLSRKDWLKYQNNYLRFKSLKEQAFKRRFFWAFIALFIGSSWLYLLNNIIYPPLHNRSTAIMAIGRYSKLGGDFKEIIQNLYSNPMLIIEQIDFYDSFFYLLILILPFVFLWKKKSLIVLTSFIPLFLSNILSESYAQRTLIHH